MKTPNIIKRLVAIGLFIMQATLINLSAQDFHQADWGMTQDDIIAIHGNPEQQYISGMIHEGNFSGIRAQLVTHFNRHRQLGKALYKFATADQPAAASANEAAYLSYQEIIRQLEKEYGAATNTVYANRSFAASNNPANFESDIIAGNKAINTYWQRDEILINLVLDLSNPNDPQFQLTYTNPQDFDYSSTLRLASKYEKPTRLASR